HRKSLTGHCRSSLNLARSTEGPGASERSAPERSVDLYGAARSAIRLEVAICNFKPRAHQAALPALRLHPARAIMAASVRPADCFTVARSPSALLFGQSGVC